MTNASSRPYPNRRLLLVEDDRLIASVIVEDLLDMGVDVVGPADSVREAMELMHDMGAVDAAVLDINLRGETVFEVADLLLARNIPFVFVTGGSLDDIPARFAAVTRWTKPVDLTQIAAALFQYAEHAVVPASRSA